MVRGDDAGAELRSEVSNNVQERLTKAMAELKAKHDAGTAERTVTVNGTCEAVLKAFDQYLDAPDPHKFVSRIMEFLGESSDGDKVRAGSGL